MTFEVEHELTCLSSMFGLSRPDLHWVEVDPQGHEHRWILPADGTSTPITPTLVWKKTGEKCFEDDDEPHEVGHQVCATCGYGPIVPGTVISHEPQYAAGLSHFRINGEEVPREEFERRFAEARSLTRSQGEPYPGWIA